MSKLQMSFEIIEGQNISKLLEEKQPIVDELYKTIFKDLEEPTPMEELCLTMFNDSKKKENEQLMEVIFLIPRNQLLKVGLIGLKIRMI